MLCWKFIEWQIITNVDTFYCLIFIDNCDSVVDAVPTNISNIFFEFNRIDFDGFLFFKQISNLDDCPEVPFFQELSKSNTNPLSFLADMDLSIFSMLSPGSPLPFIFLINIINKNPCRGRFDRVIVDLVAHNNDIMVIFKPWHLLDEQCFDDVLIFFGSFDLLDKFFKAVQVVEGDFVLRSDSDVLRIWGKLKRI